MEEISSKSNQKLVEGDFMDSAGGVNDAEETIAKIHRTLNCLGYAQLQGVRCHLDGDEIVLTGSLDSFYLKQVALSVALKLPGVRNVRNEIQVN